ncbi:MAG: nuclear transport factor 2 family protein [Caulobacteraceae bacterium]|nr:nuclear transport factor 2 family protein [Caulobacteraceae bacterium]
MADDLAALAARVRTLEDRLGRAEDRAEVQALRHRYHALLNSDRAAEIANLFAVDGELQYGGGPVVSGRDAIRAYLADLPVDWVRQFVHSNEVTVDGDRASGMADMEGRRIVRGQSQFMAGRFDDSYVRTPDGWRFASVRLSLWFATPFDGAWVVLDGKA